MKKIITTLFVLAGAVSADTAEQFNKTLQDALTGYTAGDSFTLTFTIDTYNYDSWNKQLLTMGDKYFFILEAGTDGGYAGLSAKVGGMKNADDDDPQNITGSLSGSTGVSDKVLTVEKTGLGYGWISYTVGESSYSRPASFMNGAVITLSYDAENKTAEFTFDRSNVSSSMGGVLNSDLGVVKVKMTNVTLNANDLEFSARLTSGSNLSITTGSIPEPTTATLSLLALAGLAARRRRK